MTPETAPPAVTPTAEQKRVIDVPAGEALVLGVAGSGRTEALALRAARLCAAGERPLVVTASAAGAAALRLQAERAIEGPFEELVVLTHGSAALRLATEFHELAGADPDHELLDPAERLAMMLRRIDELPLRHHEIRGAPAALIGRLIGRIDAVKRAAVKPGDYREWASSERAVATSPSDRERAELDLEFADIYAQHDAMLLEAGATDRAQAPLDLAAALRARPGLADAVAARYPHLLIDELEAATPAELGMLSELARNASSTVAACDPDQAPLEAGGWRRWSESALADAEWIQLAPCRRFGGELVDAAHAIAGPTDDGTALSRRSVGPETSVSFRRCANERAEGQSVARGIAALLASGEIEPAEICVAIPGNGEIGRSVAAALEERGVPYRLGGPGTFYRRPEVRDVLAWLRLLADPTDAPAAVRVLSRAPVGLRSVDLARCTSIARRRKLDMVSALEAALESPQISPEARDRIRSFLELYGAAARAMAEMRPDVFMRRLIERVGFRRQRLFAAHPEAAERLQSLARMGEVAARWNRLQPSRSNSEFVADLMAIADSGVSDEDSSSVPAGAVAVLPILELRGRSFDHVFVTGLTADEMPGPEPTGAPRLPSAGETDPSAFVTARRRALYTAVTRARLGVVLSRAEESGSGPARPSPFYEDARAVLGAEEEFEAEELFGPAEGLHSAYRMISDEVLSEAWKAGGGLNEPRLDTYLDVNRAVARFLELVKLAALLQRPEGVDAANADAIDAVNELLGQAISPEQAQALEESGLDAYLLDEEQDRRRRQDLIAARDEPSLEAFLPKRGAGLALSATDISLYRTCPLKYKFGRVFGIPQEPTINQRFGIAIHQVLERFHADQAGNPTRGGSLDRLLALFEEAWRRGGFGESDDEIQFRERAESSLRSYHARQSGLGAEPRWIERKFDFQVGDHHLRGRVDRVDALEGGGHELIDYKTGDPRSAAALAEDLQLAIYRLAAREAWGIEAARGSYWYLLADEKVDVSSPPDEREQVERAVVEVGEGIKAQDFEPRPSPEICGWCDFRVICPASEARGS